MQGCHFQKVINVLQPLVLDKQRDMDCSPRRCLLNKKGNAEQAEGKAMFICYPISSD